MAYVYRHIRLDKNIPFYIGIGGDEDGKHKRAYDSGLRSRNKYWNNIAAITPYEIEIIFDDISWEEACVKETEFISLYKRQKEGGTLANLTIGGEGQRGMIPWNYGKKTPEETVRKLSEKKKGRMPPNMWKMFTDEAKAKRALTVASRTYTAWNKGISPSAETIAKYMKAMEGRFLKRESHPNFGTKMPQYVKDALREANKNRPPWNKGKKCNYKVPHPELKKIVLQYDLSMNFIKQFDSVASASQSANTTKGQISNCCTGRNRFHKGFIYRYKHEKPRFQGRK